MGFQVFPHWRKRHQILWGYLFALLRKLLIFSNKSVTQVLYTCRPAAFLVFSFLVCCLVLCSPKDCSMPGFPVLHCLPGFTQIHVHWVDDAIQPSHPLSPLLMSSVCPLIKIFSSELAVCIRWPKYWSFSFSISPSSEYSGLISFRIDWFDLLAVQGTLKSLLQHHSLKTSILCHSAFFMVPTLTSILDY